jgi:hypothetical protein
MITVDQVKEEVMDSQCIHLEYCEWDEKTQMHLSHQMKQNQGPGSLAPDNPANIRSTNHSRVKSQSMPI